MAPYRSLRTSQMTDALTQAVTQLKTDEGLRLTPYLDTVGVLTIGYGRNLEHVGITEDEATAMLRADANVAQEAAQALLGPTWYALDASRQAVMINMAFNLGQTRLSNFKNMLSAIHAGDYSTAANEMLDSRWATQVGDRATRLADIMRGH